MQETHRVCLSVVGGGGQNAVGTPPDPLTDGCVAIARILSHKREGFHACTLLAHVYIILHVVILTLEF